MTLCKSLALLHKGGSNEQLVWVCCLLLASVLALLHTGGRDAKDEMCCSVCPVLVHTCTPASHAELFVWPKKGRACCNFGLIPMCQAVALQHVGAVSLLQKQARCSCPQLWHASLLQVQLHQRHAHPWGLC